MTRVLPETDDKSITEIQALINKTDKEAEVGLLKPYPYFEKDDDGQFWTRLKCNESITFTINYPNFKKVILY